MTRASHPDEGDPELRRPNHHEQYAESDNVTQGFVFHSQFLPSFASFVLFLFFILLLFFFGK